MKKIVAIIPARGGSKGIPHKNLIDFCGKPLVAWSIEQALAVPEIESVWVSSDSDSILTIASQYGARPIKRPESISGDSASSESAWIHAIDVIEQGSRPVDLVIALQPTSPVREPKDLQEGLSVFLENSYDSLFSASSLEDFTLWRVSPQGPESINFDYKKRGRRQEHVPQIVENGSFYIFSPDLIRKENNRLGGKIGFCLIELWKAFEIDSLESLDFCGVLMQNYLLSRKATHELIQKKDFHV